ncbi:MAG: gliding motility-associated C-terminal domain-containing protein [Bacteroidota bacterium]
MSNCYPFRKSSLLIIVLCCWNSLFLQGQPANDACQNAIVLTDLQDFCSEDEAFTNVNATANDETPQSLCTGDKSRDVWFAFTPLAPNISITVTGATGGNFPGGTLRRPAVELMLAVDGDCRTNNLDFIECATDDSRSGIVTVNRGGLVPGTEYLIRVQGTTNRAGTFKLCINNYTPPFPPQSDCDQSHLLCDKSSFPVERVEGAGEDPDEAEGTCLDCQPGFNTESSSTWYKWIAATSGSLTFTLTPDNPEDDLDFALYELPGGLNDCDNKQLLRCVASGQNVGQPLSQWVACTGATGLLENDGDVEEACGCQNGDNNFVEAIQMEEGKVYALLINNFSETDNGFTISFGGTGEFLGPTPNAEFVANDGDFCAGTEVTFSGASSSFQLGDIVDYQWSFGDGATPTTASGVGPHAIAYETPGEKNVLLTVETDLGCIASDVEEAIVVIEPCCDDKNSINATGETTDVVCLGSRGAVDVSATSASPILAYEWSNDANTEDIEDLAPDDYQLTITNLATCEEVVTFTVDSVAPFEITTDITMPTCNGGTDGTINLTVTGEAVPILVDFGNGFTEAQTLADLSVGDYQATVQDANGCEETLDITVTELELVLDSSALAITAPTCNGFSNGRIALTMANGEPNYQYDWGDGNNFVPTSSLNNVPAGDYTVAVIDRNECKGQFDFRVNEPDALTLLLDTVDVSCQGANDGQVTAIAEGGTADYLYEWDNTQTTEQINNLAPGTYTLVVRDANECETTGTALIIEPEGINLAVRDIQDVTCAGDNTGIISLEGIGGNGNYEFSADGVNFQNSSDLGGLAAGDYEVFIRDPQGCVQSTMATIRQPEALTVDAGEDQMIDLGYSVDFQTITTPFTRPVTFNWNNAEYLDCTDCSDPTATPPTTIPFVVTVTDETNCTASDTILVSVNTNRPIFIPNVFSPNFDGRNDNFTIYSGPAGIRISELSIYDRWGEQIYRATDLPISDGRVGWNGEFDGRAMPPSVYAYVAKVLFFDQVEEIYEGSITLVR